MKEHIEKFINMFEMRDDIKIWIGILSFLVVTMIFMLCGGACLISIMVKAFSFPMFILLIISGGAELYWLFCTAFLGCVLAVLIDEYPEE